MFEALCVTFLPTARMHDNSRMQKLRKKFGQGIAKVRRKRGFTQQELAQRCRIHRNYLSRVERGDTNVSFTVMNSIAKALRISMSELLKDL
jgi:transcriptional regulator with XRE-family HTH domain